MTEAARKKANQLLGETSPYLLQHAYNPVDWHPWGEEALEKARAQQRPIFLSIGYSACHWCHVMEHESFENEDIASLMNGYFINIKVDREERPDLDQIYMNSVMLLTRHGGWPMSVFLTPQLKPFYGGTYWPPESRMGLPGFRDIVEKVHEAWETRRESVLHTAEQLTNGVVTMSRPQGDLSPLAESLLEGALRALLRAADGTHGGFGTAPKFPHPMDLRVLLRAWKRFGSEEALEVVRLTLDKMARGGIYDHLGGGFHRYSTDAKWLVPHFEKMLYDNALLTSTYLEAYQATRIPDYARVVRETLDYVLREMTQPEGGFYSTQDADSEGVEGKFFVWTEDEVVDQLGPEQARLFNDCYDVTPHGNWEGGNILNRVNTHQQAAQLLGLDEAELAEILNRSKQTLFDVRRKRIPPGRDDKVLTSWNGLMIAALAQAAQIFGEDTYATAAREAADFILNHLFARDGRLLHAYKDGRAHLNAYLEDYACLIDGLVEVYQATFEVRYLEEALKLAEMMIAQFHDPNAGGFFFTSNDHEPLIARNKDSQDNATPSGNSMAATALLKLGRLCGNSDLQQKAVETLEILSGQLAEIPQAAGQALIAVDFLLGPTYEVVLINGDRPEETDEVLAALHSRFLPNKVVLGNIAAGETLPSILQPLLTGKTSQAGAATIYLCEQGMCREPAVGVSGLQAAFE